MTVSSASDCEMRTGNKARGSFAYTDRLWRAGLASLALAVGAAIPVTAQPVCLARAALLHQLRRDFGEHLLWQGRLTAGPGQEAPVLEIFVNPDGGSWTLIHSLPNGMSCFVAGGQRWAPATPPSEGRKS